MPARIATREPKPTAVPTYADDISLSSSSGASFMKHSTISKTRGSSRTSPPFLRIPPEIRREIYRYLLPSSTKKFVLYTDCGTTPTDETWNRKYRPHPDRFTLNILRTSRLIYLESIAVLYSENLFHFFAFNYLPVLDFIRHLSPEAKSLVRRVRLTPLAENKEEQQATNHKAFCTYIHDALPGLYELQADPLKFL